MIVFSDASQFSNNVAISIHRHHHHQSASSLYHHHYHDDDDHVGICECILHNWARSPLVHFRACAPQLTADQQGFKDLGEDIEKIEMNFFVSPCLLSALATIGPEHAKLNNARKLKPWVSLKC